MSAIIRFGIIGGGWRAAFYLRIAAALPQFFEVTRMLVRDSEKGRAITEQWGVRTVQSMADFLHEPDYAFAVVSVSRTACPDYLAALADADVPVLSETPPAEDLTSLTALWERVGPRARIQVAEQYLFQPMHAARLAVVRSGRLGAVSHVQVSAAHAYHGMSLIRHLLGVGFEEAAIRGERFVGPLTKGPDRSGPPQAEGIADSVQELATLRFDDGRSAVFDFAKEQYFSWIRGNRVLVRGERGEIVNNDVRWLPDYRTPVELGMKRVDTGHDGNLEGYYHAGVTLGAEWLYRNPFAPGRLSDDEIAIAACLVRMGEYAADGTSFYSLAEAAQDHYLSLMMTKAIDSGEAVRTTVQPWGQR
ncbi:Gfo/Idh/MocA family protein [Paenibacillus phyllosphaerae]|nr:Gfo/Idh/MocA family oxidoreductase [Paenibacillus phyllosphaerae]